MKANPVRTEKARLHLFNVKGRVRRTPDLERLLDRRMRKLERRFPGHLHAVDVVLADLNGPRGGVDKRCRFNLILKHHGPLSAFADASKPEVAIARAAERANRMIVRRLLRKRGRRVGTAPASIRGRLDLAAAA